MINISQKRSEKKEKREKVKRMRLERSGQVVTFRQGRDITGEVIRIRPTAGLVKRILIAVKIFFQYGFKKY